MTTTDNESNQKTTMGKGQTPDPSAASIEPEALKTLALSLSKLVANRSKNPHVSAAARFISTTLSQP